MTVEGKAWENGNERKKCKCFLLDHDESVATIKDIQIFKHSSNLEIFQAYFMMNVNY